MKDKAMRHASGRVSWVRAGACVWLYCAGAQASESVSLDMTNVRIQNNLQQSRSSAPNTIDPANNYTVTYTNVMARGSGGILGAMFPSPTPIETIIHTLDPTADFPSTAEVPNPSGTHPVVLNDQTYNGTQVLSGITVTFSAHLVAQINADSTVSFTISSVTISPSILVGSLLFTSGTVTVTRHPLVVCDSIDFNRDTLFPDVADIDDFLAVFAGAPCPTPACGDIDFNNDGLFPDVADIDALLRVFSGEAC